MAHDDVTAQSHDHADEPREHAHEHAYGHGHAHEHAHEHAHGPAHAAASKPAPRTGITPDLAKVVILVNNWIDHNEGHRRTYLEWSDKLAEAGVPRTVAALARIADLTDQATKELKAAAVELRDAQPTKD